MNRIKAFLKMISNKRQVITLVSMRTTWLIWNRHIEEQQVHRTRLRDLNIDSCLSLNPI